MGKQGENRADACEPSFEGGLSRLITLSLQYKVSTRNGAEFAAILDNYENEQYRREVLDRWLRDDVLNGRWRLQAGDGMGDVRTQRWGAECGSPTWAQERADEGSTAVDG